MVVAEAYTAESGRLSVMSSGARSGRLPMVGLPVLDWRVGAGGFFLGPASLVNVCLGASANVLDGASVGSLFSAFLRTAPRGQTSCGSRVELRWTTATGVGCAPCGGLLPLVSHMVRIDGVEIINRLFRS